MLKRLTTPLLLVMISTGAQALTLGQIHVHSYISQPLKATIDLQGVKADELTALDVKLASRAAFKNAGVDWSDQLESLNFSVIQTNKGPAIRVTSRKAVVEPFLSFVVDARWANGKMIKDFTLLLDPPLYSGKKAAPVAVADAASVTARQPVQSDDLNPQQQDVSQAPPQGEAKAASPGSGAKESTAQRVTGTSLWQAALKVRPADATMQQTMVAIHEENPESFIRGNMNLLMKGQLLRIPSAEVIQGVSENGAVKRVAKHERALRAGKSITSSKRLSPEITALAAEQTERPAQPPETAAAQPPGSGSGGRLRLDSATDAVNEGSFSGDLPPGKSGLSTDAAGGDENRALRSRVALLEEQLKVAHKLIRMKGELAQLQQLYRQIDTQNVQADADQTEITDEELLLLAEAAPDQEPLSVSDDAGMPETEETSGNSGKQQAPDTTPIDTEPTAAGADQQLTAADQSAVETATAADQATVDTVPRSIVDEAASEESAAEAGDDVTASRGDAAPGPGAAADEEVAASTTLKTKEEQNPRTMPAAVPAEATIGESAELSTPVQEQAAVSAARRDSLIEGIDNNLLFGAGGVGILGLLLSFLLGRLGRKENAVGEPGFKDEALVGEIRSAWSLDDESREVELKGEYERERATQPSVADEAPVKQPNQESTTQFVPPEALSIDEPQALDPLKLAKVLIRNKETRQARDLLKQAIEADPDRADLHIQLMELLYTDKERHAFEEHMNQMEQSGLNIDSQQWQAIERMHGELLPAGIESLGIVNQKYSEAEMIDLQKDVAEKDGSVESGAGRISDKGVGESEDLQESDLEAALREFEMELDGNRSDELLAEAGLALDETAEILDNPLTSAIPDARMVEDLELAEDLVIEESEDTDQEAEVISLDDSFGIDSHISSDFDDIFTKSAVQPGQQDDTPSSKEQERLSEADAEALSISSFDTDPSALKQAEADAKIDLAAAFADMGDVDGARDILDEVMTDGTRQQKRAAQEMLKKYL